MSIQLRKCKGCERYDPPEEDIRYAERVLAQGERYGFRVVVVLLATPWANQSDYWNSESLKADIVKKWGQVAMRLRGFAALQAYDLINEPVVPGAMRASGLTQWHELATKIAREVRALDPDTPLMFEPTGWGLPGAFWQTEPLALPGVVYSFQLYAPPTSSRARACRATLTRFPTRALVGTRRRLAQETHEARKFAATHNVPMFIGEFSCVRWAPAGSCPRYLADAVSLFEAEGWGWPYHCWRCYQGWDAEVPPNVPRERRAGFLPKHRRSDHPTLLLLKKAMESNRKSARN